MFILQVELRSQVIISRISLDNCWQWPSHWIDLPLSTALLNSSFRVSPVNVRAGLALEAAVSTGGELSTSDVLNPSCCPSTRSIRKTKCRSFWMQFSWKHQTDSWETDGHGLFPELWQHKLWQQILLPTSPLLKTHTLPPKSQAACPSHGWKETDDTAGLLVYWHSSVTLVGFDNADTLQIKTGLDSYQNSSHQSQNSCHKETVLGLRWPGLKCQQHQIKSVLQ